MKLTKRLQNGILLCLYISRGGRVTVEGAAEGLQLSKVFLQSIANALKNSGILKSFKGPNGGYELNGDPTIMDVFESLSPVSLKGPIMGNSEQRALAHYLNNLRLATLPVLNRKIRNVMNDLVANEVAKMDRIATDSAIN